MKILIDSKKFMAENGEELMVEYFLTKDEQNKHRTFGTEIVMCNKEQGTCEVEVARNVFASEDEAREIIQKLAHGHVTPISAREILEDYVI